MYLVGCVVTFYTFSRHISLVEVYTEYTQHSYSKNCDFNITFVLVCPRATCYRPRVISRLS